MIRNSSIDVAKLICAILIYCLHSGFSQSFSPVIYSVLENGIFRIGVPFFFIVTGYYFFNNVKTAADLYGWCKGVLLIYIFWMAVYLPFYFNKTVFTYVFGYWHLWYLMALLLGGGALYAIKEWKHSFVMVVVIAISGVLIQYERSIANIDNSLVGRLISHDYFTRSFLFFALPYLYFGWVINKYNLKNRIDKKIAMLMLFFSFALVVAEAALQPFLIVNQSFTRDLLFSNMVFVPLLLIACLVYVLEIDNKKTRLLRDLSAVIFLIHPLAIMISNNSGLVSYRIVLQIALMLILILLTFFTKKYLKFIF